MVSSSVANKPNLVSLNLSHNRLERIDRRIFWTTPNLEVLDLSYNLLSNGLEALVSTCKSLRDLNLAHNRFEKLEHFKNFRFLKKLKQLELGNNPFLEKKLDLDVLLQTIGCRNIRLCRSL